MIDKIITTYSLGTSFCGCGELFDAIWGEKPTKTFTKVVFDLLTEPLFQVTGVFLELVLIMFPATLIGIFIVFAFYAQR